MSLRSNATPRAHVRLQFTAISVFCVIILATLTGCQRPMAAATGEGPAITLGKVSHDFGDVGPTTVHKAEFKFTSTGTVPLVIKGVEVCCGTVTRGVKDGQSYAPGRSGTLEVEYHAAAEPGTMERDLYLYTNDPNNEVIPLTIKAEVMQRIGFEPSRLRLFLKRDNAGASDLTLKSLDGRPFAITDFRSTGDAISAKFDPDVEATEFVLKLQVDLEKLEGHPRGQIRLALTHPECSEVFILYDVLPEFTVIPSSLTVFDFEPGKTVRREISLFGNYQDDYEIESVTSTKGHIKLVEQSSVTGRAGDMMTTSEPDRIAKRCTLVVDFTAPEDDDTTVVSDELLIKMTSGETVTVSCRGFYKGS